VIKGHKWTATKWMRVGPYGAKRELDVQKKIAEANAKAHGQGFGTGSGTRGV
jgi:hypothetical protein